MYLKAFIQNLVQIGTVVFEKIQFDFCMYTTLGQGHEMTLTLNTHIYSIGCLLILPFKLDFKKNFEEFLPYMGVAAILVI